MAGSVVKATFTGGRQLLADLNELDDRLSKKIAQIATARAARIVLLAAKGYAPVWPNGPHKLREHTFLPGNLRDNIYMFRNKSRVLSGSQHIVTVRKGKKTQNGAFYGFFVEYGTKKFGPRSFMRRAFNENATRCEEEIRQALGEGIADSARIFKSMKFRKRS